jgi:mRNA interferase MazF
VTRSIAPWQVWWTDFDPQVGQEQAGRRPAIVVGTTLACSLPNRLVIVVPCTTKNRGLPFQPAIELEQPSFAMCDQMKSIIVNRLINQHSTTLRAAEIEAIKFALRQMIDVG